MARKQIGLKLDEELLARIDRALKPRQTRTSFIEQALERELGSYKPSKAASTSSSTSSKPEKATVPQVSWRRVRRRPRRACCPFLGRRISVYERPGQHSGRAAGVPFA
jgi:hypothetical protein